MAADEAHVDPEIGKHARSLDEPERKQDTGPSLVETAIPIPDFFYDIRSTLPLVGSSHGVVRSLRNFLNLITIGIFVGTFAYYSLPAQLLSEESIVSSEWQKEGYACKPASANISRPALCFPLQVQSSDPYSKEFRVQLDEYGLTSKMYPTGDPDASRKKLASSVVSQFRWPTKIDFGHGGVEIVSEYSNNRFLFRDSAHDPFKISPVPIAGPHSVVYNPKDHLYYAGDSGNNRVITFRNISSGNITSQAKILDGFPLVRPHDIVIDSSTGWIYVINSSGRRVFRFTALGENESSILLPVIGYTRGLTFVNGSLYVIGTVKRCILEVVDWDRRAFNIYQTFAPASATKSRRPAGSWTTTGLLMNDAEIYMGFWYVSSYFTKSHSNGSDYDENKLIRFKTLEDIVQGTWTDISSLVPTGMFPYFFTVRQDKLYVGVCSHESTGHGEGILEIHAEDVN